MTFLNKSHILKLHIKASASGTLKPSLMHDLLMLLTNLYITPYKFKLV